MSMFSQSLLLGDDTFGELEQQHQQPQPPPVRPPESMGIIEESPTNQTECRSRMVTIRRTQKTKRIVTRTASDSNLGATRNHVKQRPAVTDEAAGNFSEFFRSDLEFKENSNVAAQRSVPANGSLDRYFGDSIDFNETAKSSRPNKESGQRSKGGTDDNNAADLGDMFAKSDFFSQMNSADKTVTNASATRLDMPISTEDMCDMSFDDSGFTAQPGPSSTRVPAAARVQPSTEVVEPVVESEDIIWDDSADFANTFSGETNPSQAVPRIFVNLPAPATVATLSNEPPEEIAQGIDNVTFTQDFLRTRSTEPDHITEISRNGTNSNQPSSVNQFIQHEMDKCQKLVSRGLANANATLNNSLLDASTTSDIVLNYSADSVPMTTHKPQPVIAEPTKADRPKQLPSQNLNQIDQWGLSQSVVEQYHRKGIKTMFDWQVECLSNTKVLFDGANLVYSAPTSAGKTLVSELLMIKNVLEQRRKSLFILPFISVVREKMFYLQELLAPGGLTVEGFFGGYSPPCGFQATDIAVCTIEKANSIVNKLLEQQRIDQLGCIVVDEIHLISDASRGYILELLLAKILYACRRFGHRIQIVTMSATLPNLELLTRWLGAEFYRTDFRPVALHEMIKIDNTIYDQRMQPLRQLDATAFAAAALAAKDQDGVGQLCAETLLEGCAVIVFCPSKDWCESLSTHVAGFIYAMGKCKDGEIGPKLRAALNMEAIAELKAQLRNSAAGLDAVMEKAISYGCAFHHAGLTTDERDIVEAAFKAGTLKVLVATSTLSSGVNLPARRVLIRSPMFGGKVMNALTYKQMIGRAGRTGKDTLGESILICGAANKMAGRELVCAQLPVLRSCLAADGHVHLKRAILEIIAAGMAASTNDLEQFTNSTLLAAENGVLFSCAAAIESLRDQRSTRSRRSRDSSAVLDSEAPAAEDDSDPIATCLRFLLRYEFVRLQSDDAGGDAHFVATRLGMACLASSMPPGDGFLLFSELQRSRQSFVLESELHAVYLVTPFSVCYQMQSIDWLGYLDMWERLPAAMRRVGEMVGVRESFLVKAMRAQKLEFKALQVHKRFYTALALQELVNETNVNVVAAKYKCSRGMLQSLQQMASTFAAVVTAFCTALNWNLLALIIEQFRERLFFGVHRELIDLMRLSNLNGQRARCLFDGGFKTLAELANADGRTVERVLYDSIGFDAKQREGETDFEAARRNKVRCLYITGRAGLTVQEAAKLLIEDARRYLEQEMGLQNVQWNVIDAGDEMKMENAPVEQAIAQIRTESEDIFQTKSPQPERKITPKRKPTELPENVAEFRPPSDEPRRSGTRKSPRIQQQPQFITPVRSGSNTKLPNPAPAKNDVMTSESDAEIISTPVQTQKNRTRTQQNRTAQLKKTVQKNARKTAKPTVENPMQNQIIDANSIDSIGFSRTRNGSNTSSSMLNSSHILSVLKSDNHADDDGSNVLDKLDIINVCGDPDLFAEFAAEVGRAQELSLALAVSHNLPKARRSTVIGGNLMRADATPGANDSLMRTNRRCVFDENMLYINGVTICVGESPVCFYMEMQDHKTGSGVQFAEKIALLESICSRPELTLRMYDAKEQCKALRKAVPSIRQFGCRLEDPRIAGWLLQPDVDSSLHQMAEQFAPECVGLCQLGGNALQNGALGMHYLSEVVPRLRAAVDCTTAGPILRGQKENLMRLGSGDILKSFAEMEMPIQQSLIAMEIAGMSVCPDQLSQLTGSIADLMRRLEGEMFKLHGRRFNVASAGEVAKVLGMRKKAGDTGKVSTAKAALQKLVGGSDPMPDWIMQWRKLSAAVTKTLRPLQQNLYRRRIHGSSWSLTQTGRISMHEPNVQNVAKDFVVTINAIEYPISCRSCFRCPDDRVLLSADFCQIELRILSHLSVDPLMVRVMQSDGDVFTTIAATWNRIAEAQVTVEQRNRTKQICYGIIYGMGAKAMAATLQSDEETARTLCDSFHKTYPGIRAYTERIVSFARQQGYVETLAGRRRYLAAIQAEGGDSSAERAQAERQAVNTTIQGSAADVAKYAILRMERNLSKYARTLRINVAGDASSRVALVLHLHDELVYEVPADRVKSVAKVLRSSMENCAKMNVPLRVKLKAGRSWGEMETLDM